MIAAVLRRMLIFPPCRDALWRQTMPTLCAFRLTPNAHRAHSTESNGKPLRDILKVDRRGVIRTLACLRLVVPAVKLEFGNKG